MEVHMAGETTPFPTSSETSAPPLRGPNGSGESDYGSSLDETAEASAARAEDLIQRIAQTAHQTIDRLAETAAPHVSRLQEGISGAGGTLQERADRAREVSDEWAETLRCTVRENPLAAVGVALAVGLLVARLTR
jgi:ElaB/YqjD/DUF883 family membrane-anchored ribosome-binding protein